MLAREYCTKVPGIKKPVIVSHHMLSGMCKPVATEKKEGDDSDGDDHIASVTNKMSKSNPMSAIFMEDEESEVIRKIKAAHCLPGIEYEGKDKKGNPTLMNPILDYCKSIIFPAQGEMKITIKDKGEHVFSCYEDLRDAFVKGDVHPSDLKPSVATAINQLLHPVREHFKNDPYASGLLAQIKTW